MTNERQFAMRTNVYDDHKCPAYAALGRMPSPESRDEENMVWEYDDLAGMLHGDREQAISESEAKELWLKAIERSCDGPAAFGERVARKLGWLE